MPSASTRGLVFIGSHIGYPMDRTPLGGGAMVGLHLARRWSQDPAVRLAVLGSGPEAPFPTSERACYTRLAAEPQGLVDLSELAYARFCRRFEKATTQWLLARRAEWRPEETVVVVNDISESPDLAALKAAGYRILSIWHVDVVDYFNKLYLRGVVAAPRVTALYEALRRARLSSSVPDVLKLIFEKQRQTVAYSDIMALPSHAMAATVESCYAPSVDTAAALRARCLVQPWGAVGDWKAADPRRVEELKRHYQITSRSDIIMTLSRISPEKGIHLLIDALARLERQRRLRRDTVLLICGEAAFMMGQAYLRRVRRAAARLRLRCFFPGYLSSEDKPAYFALASLCVSPSVHESYGLNVVEALRAGLPVVASDHYGVQDILEDAYGVRVPYHNLKQAPEDLANALERLLGDRQRLKTMGTAAAQAAAGMNFDSASAKLRAAALSLLPSAAGG